MNIPDNFVLLCFAVVLIGIGWIVPTNTAAAQMLAQLWAIMLVLLKPEGAILPYSYGTTTTTATSSKETSVQSVPDTPKIIVGE